MPLYSAGIVPAHYERIHIQIYIVDQQSASQPITRAGCGTLLIGGGEEEWQGNGAAKNRSAVALCVCVCVSVYVCVCVCVSVCVCVHGWLWCQARALTALAARGFSLVWVYDEMK